MWGSGAVVKAKFLLDEWKVTVGDVELTDSSWFRLNILRRKHMGLLSGVRGRGKGSGCHVLARKHEG